MEDARVTLIKASITFLIGLLLIFAKILIDLYLTQKNTHNLEDSDGKKIQEDNDRQRDNTNKIDNGTRPLSPHTDDEAESGELESSAGKKIQEDNDRQRDNTNKIDNEDRPPSPHADDEAESGDKDE